MGADKTGPARNRIASHKTQLSPSEGHLSRNLILIPLENHVDPLTNKFRHGNLGLFIEQLQLLILVFGDVNGCGYLFS